MTTLTVWYTRTLAAAARSDAWIAASYQNQLDPAGTVTLGAQQAR